MTQRDAQAPRHRRESPAIDRSVLEGMAARATTARSTSCWLCSAIAPKPSRFGWARCWPSEICDEYANAAHRLRGAALSMGARTLAETAGALYAAARAKGHCGMRQWHGVVEITYFVDGGKYPGCCGSRTSARRLKLRTRATAVPDPGGPALSPAA